VWDTRRVLAWVRAQGAPAVGIYGMSLGAYVGASVAGVEDVDLIVGGVPICDVPELFAGHCPPALLPLAERHGLIDERARELLRAASPLALPVRTEPAARHLYAGRGDRMATPAQARRLWEHWDRPDILWYPGGHVSFAWSRSVASYVARTVQPFARPPA
jgi:alpha/beta superfamily hydrolase